MDGEIAGFDYKKNQNLPFSTLQSLKESDNKDPGNLKIYIFDILFLDEEELCGKELRERREILASMKTTKEVTTIEGTILKREDDQVTEEHIAALLNQAKKDHFEGLVIKSLNSYYLGGSRIGWYKIKYLSNDRKDSLDLIIIGGYFGKVRSKGNFAQQSGFFVTRSASRRKDHSRVQSRHGDDTGANGPVAQRFGAAGRQKRRRILRLDNLQTEHHFQAKGCCSSQIRQLLVLKAFILSKNQRLGHRLRSAFSRL